MNTKATFNDLANLRILAESKIIAIKDLSTNDGQIEGLPKNPRQIRDHRYDKLKKSIEDAPEMLNLRELLVYPIGGKYVVIGGNMRLRACKDLGYKKLPCKILDSGTPVEKLREIVIKDNESFGQYDWDLVANEWDADEITGWGVELPIWDEPTPKEIENKEVDVDEFSDAMEVKFKFSIEEWQFLNSCLQKIDANKEKALLKKFGYDATA